MSDQDKLNRNRPTDVGGNSEGNINDISNKNDQAIAFSGIDDSIPEVTSPEFLVVGSVKLAGQGPWDGIHRQLAQKDYDELLEQRNQSGDKFINIPKGSVISRIKLDQSCPLKIGENSVVGSNTPPMSLIDDKCIVESESTINNCLIGDHVFLGQDVTLSQCGIGHKCEGAGAIILSKCDVGPEFYADSIAGMDGCVVSSGFSTDVIEVLDNNNVFGPLINIKEIENAGDGNTFLCFTGIDKPGLENAQKVGNENIIVPCDAVDLTLLNNPQMIRKSVNKLRVTEGCTFIQTFDKTEEQNMDHDDDYDFDNDVGNKPDMGM